MENNILYLIEQELLDGAKRVIPQVYDEKQFFSCKIGEEIRKEIDPKFKEFYTELELRILTLCCMKKNDADYTKENVELKSTIEHLKKYKNFKEKLDKIDINSVVDSIAQDIIKNKYSDDNLFELVPKLADKYMKCHHDSVDCKVIIWLLEDALKKYNYKITSTNLSSLHEF